MIFWAQRCKIVKRCPKISFNHPKKTVVGGQRWHHNVTNAHEMLETYLVRYDSGYGFGLSPCLSPLFSIFIFKNIKSFSVINWTSSSIRKSAILNSYKCSKIKKSVWNSTHNDHFWQNTVETYCCHWKDQQSDCNISLSDHVLYWLHSMMLSLPTNQ